MTDWIEQSVKDAAGHLWANVWYWLGFQFVDPFYGWLIPACLIVAGVTALAWFFGGLFPALRWIAGIIVVCVTFGLYAYARGEKDARAFDKKRGRR